MKRRLGALPVIAILITSLTPFAALAAGLPSAPPESLGFSAERLKRVDALMQRYVSEKKMAGMTVAIARDGKLAYLRSAGMADIAARRPMRDDTIARYYSMTKPVTAVAALMLVEEGKLRLDDELAAYPADAFPNHIEAKWGFYKTANANSTKIERDPTPKGTKSDNPPLPDLAVTPPAINRDGPTALLGALQKQDKAITMYFITDVIIEERKAGLFSSKTNMKDRIWLKFGGEREATRRQYVKAAYDAVGVHVTMD